MGNAYAFETITILDKPIGFTQKVFSSNLTDNPHTVAVVTVEGGPMRYRYDGSKPSDTSGHLKSHGDKIIIDGDTNINNFMAVKVSERPSILSITYERAY